MKNSKILVACEFSGIVRDAFIAKGHDAISCDILPTEKPGPHYQGDVRDILYNYWDMIIAFPPCTYLSVSGIHWNKRRPERAIKTEEALEFAKLFFDHPCEKIAIENPISIISSRIRKPNQIIQPYWFGHNASKKTCLWLKGLPLLKPTNYIEGNLFCCGLELDEGLGKYGCPNCNGDNIAKRRWGNQTPSGQNKLGPSANRAKERGRTYEGIAAAMAIAWGQNGN